MHACFCLYDLIRLQNSFTRIYVYFIGIFLQNSLICSAGFTNVSTIDQIKDAYPLLDMVDHNNRRIVVSIGPTHYSRLV